MRQPIAHLPFVLLQLPPFLHLLVGQYSAVHVLPYQPVAQAQFPSALLQVPPCLHLPAGHSSVVHDPAGLQPLSQLQVPIFSFFAKPPFL